MNSVEQQIAQLNGLASQFETPANTPDRVAEIRDKVAKLCPGECYRAVTLDQAVHVANVLLDDIGYLLNLIEEQRHCRCSRGDKF